MPKKLSELQKKEMIDSFVNGKSIDQLSEIYNYSRNTIIRHLKGGISKDKYKELTSRKNNSKDSLPLKTTKNQKFLSKVEGEFEDNESDNKKIYTDSSFIEIVPLDCQIDNEPQKNFASISIKDIDFPEIVYMVVDKKIELETKYLREYPDWQFLSQEELNRKTIEIYADIKIAKRYCNKEQKVIKVPNTNVFKIVAPLLVAKGISRIVSKDRLISL